MYPPAKPNSAPTSAARINAVPPKRGEPLTGADGDGFQDATGDGSIAATAGTT